MCAYPVYGATHQITAGNSHIQIKFQVFYLPILNEDTIK